MNGLTENSGFGVGWEQGSTSYRFTPGPKLYSGKKKKRGFPKWIRSVFPLSKTPSKALPASSFPVLPLTSHFEPAPILLQPEPDSSYHLNPNFVPAYTFSTRSSPQTSHRHVCPNELLAHSLPLFCILFLILFFPFVLSSYNYNSFSLCFVFPSREVNGEIDSICCVILPNISQVQQSTC